MMDQHTCRYLLDSLSDYVDGSLGKEFCAEIDRHLENCENCRIVIDSLRKTVYLYHSTSSQTPTVPNDVKQRLFRRLELEDIIGKSD